MAYKEWLENIQNNNLNKIPGKNKVALTTWNYLRIGYQYLLYLFLIFKHIPLGNQTSPWEIKLIIGQKWLQDEKKLSGQIDCSLLDEASIHPSTVHSQPVSFHTILRSWSGVSQPASLQVTA